MSNASSCETISLQSKLNITNKRAKKFFSPFTKLIKIINLNLKNFYQKEKKTTANI